MSCIVLVDKYPSILKRRQYLFLSAVEEEGSAVILIKDEAVGASVDDFVFFFAGSRFFIIVLGSTFRRGTQ
jgi:hypothetical protein